MGQAKLRGTREMRVLEGIAKRKLREEARQAEDKEKDRLREEAWAAKKKQREDEYVAQVQKGQDKLIPRRSSIRYRPRSGLLLAAAAAMAAASAIVKY